MSSAFRFDAFGRPRVQIDGHPLVGLGRDPVLGHSLFAIGPSQAANASQAHIVVAAYVDERDLTTATGMHALQLRVIPWDTFTFEYTPAVAVINGVPVFDIADDPSFESRVLEGPDFTLATVEAQPNGTGAQLSAAIPIQATGMPIMPVDGATFAAGPFAVGFDDGIDSVQQRALFRRSVVLRLRVAALVELLATFGRTERATQYLLAVFAADSMGNVSMTDFTQAPDPT